MPLSNLQKAMHSVGMSKDLKIPFEPKAVPMSLQQMGIVQPDPPCPQIDCAECLQQWIRPFKVLEIAHIYAHVLDDDEASRLLNMYVASIERNKHWLRDTLAANGDVIVAR